MNAGGMLAHDWFPQPLPANVALGQRSWCYSSFSCLHYRSRRSCGLSIGHDTGIYHGTFFDLGPEGEVEIGNFCTLVGVNICTNARVVIADYAFLAHEVVLADTFAPMPFPPSAAGMAEPSRGERPVVIHLGENCWIGARAVLLAGARIGKGAIVGAAALVNFAVPPLAIVAGNPAKIVGWTGTSASARAAESPELRTCDSHSANERERGNYPAKAPEIG